MGVRGEWDSDGNLVVDPRSAFAESGAKSRFWRREWGRSILSVGYSDSVNGCGEVVQRTYTFLTDWGSLELMRKYRIGVQRDRERRARFRDPKRSESVPR